VLQAIEGVTAVATVSGLPFEGGMGVDISSGPDAKVDEGFQSTAYLAGPGTLKALGLQLVRGRDFVGTEYLPAKGMSNVENVSEVIVSRALAGHLFDGGDALGRLLYISGHPVQIVGVVDHLMNMSPQLGAADNEYAMLIPLEPDGSDVTFVLNMAKKDRNSVLKRAVAVLANRHPTRVLDHAEEFSDVRDGYFQREASMVGLMLVAALALLLVTVAGTMGLMSFWMRQRTRSIGIRRALGATRSDIFRYFLTENFLIVSCGVALGCILAYGLNILLVRYFEAELLPVAYLSTGAAALWMVGLVAGFGPALRAVSVPPAVATRSL
jgi:putative ABC transport system permease protein